MWNKTSSSLPRFGLGGTGLHRLRRLRFPSPYDNCLPPVDREFSKALEQSSAPANSEGHLLLLGFLRAPRVEWCYSFQACSKVTISRLVFNSLLVARYGRSLFRSRSRARCKRDFTAPTSVPTMLAISLSASPSYSKRTNASLCKGGKLETASCTFTESSSSNKPPSGSLPPAMNRFSAKVP